MVKTLYFDLKVTHIICCIQTKQQLMPMQQPGQPTMLSTANNHRLQ